MTRGDRLLRSNARGGEKPPRVQRDRERGRDSSFSDVTLNMREKKIQRREDFGKERAEG